MHFYTVSLLLSTAVDDEVEHVFAMGARHGGALTSYNLATDNAHTR